MVTSPANSITSAVKQTLNKYDVLDELGIYKPGLKLFGDPRNHILGKHRREILSENVVRNGNFTDFTMPNDSNTVAHWVFDSSYHQKGYGDVLGKTRSIYLNGVDASLDTPDAADLDLPDEWTLYVRFIPFSIPTGSDVGMLVSKWGDSTSLKINYTLQLRPGGVLRTLVSDSTNATKATLDSSVTIEANKEYIVIIKYHGPTQEFSIEVNKTKDSMVTGFNQCAVNTGPFTIGKFDFPWSSYNHFYHGVIKHVILYNKSIPEDTERKLRAGFFDLTNAVAAYDFTRVTDWTIDQSGLNHTLTSTNAVSVRGGLNYVGSDVSNNSTIIGENILTNAGGEGATDWVDSDGNGIPDNWNEGHNTGVGSFTEIRTDNDGKRYVHIDNKQGSYYGLYRGAGQYTIGKTYLITYLYRSNGPHGIELVSPGYYPFGSRVPSSNNQWKRFTGILYASDNQRLSVYTFDSDTYMDIKEFEMFEVVTGLPLQRMTNFWIEDQTNVGDSSIFKDGDTITFDGTDDYFAIDGSLANTLNPGTGDFTIEFVSEVPSVGSSTRVIAKRDAGSTHGYEVILYNTGIACFLGDGTNWVQPTAAHNLTVGNIHHFAIRIDRTNNTLEYYVDGTLLNTSDISTITGAINPSAEFRVGTNFEKNLFYSGRILEIRYSNIARSAHEIRQDRGLGNGWVADNAQSDAGKYENYNWRQLVNRDGSTNANWQIYQNNIPLEKGAYYRFRFKAQRIAGTATSRCFFYDGVNYYGLVSWTTVPTSETHYEYIFKSEGTSGTLYIGSGTGDNVYWDISIHKISNASFGRGLIEDLSKGGARFEIVSQNNGFEDGTLNYHGTNTTYNFTITTAKTYSGTYALEVTGTGSTDYRIINRQSAYITTGNGYDKGLYEISAMVYVPEGWTGGDFLFSTDATIGNIIRESSQNTTPVPGKWTRIVRYFEFDGTDPSGVIWLRNTAATTQTFYIDDFIVKKITNGNHGIFYGELENNQHTELVSINYDNVNDYISFGNPDNIKNPNKKPLIVFWWQKGGADTDALNKHYFNFEPRIGISNFAGYVGRSTSPYWIDISTYSIPHGVNVDDWHFYVYIIDFPAKEVHLYVDNIYKGTVSHQDMDLYDDGYNLELGRRSGTTLYYMNGDVGIYGIYLFDGKDGAPDHIPYNHEEIILGKLYTATKRFYQ